VKTSSSEPVFFSELAATLTELDHRFGTNFGARLAVFNWPRERIDLTNALIRNCDRIVAFGDDVTIDQLRELALNGRLVAFGNRVSGAVVMSEALAGIALERTAQALALDCAMFDQRGCLSPHHIFVEGDVREFCERLAAAFSALAPVLVGKGNLSALGLQDGAAIRRVRETAQWRRLGGAEVELWEGRDFQWTLVVDHAASFTSSPGFCTIFVSPFNSPSDLERRFESMRGKIEGCAIASGECAFDTADGRLRANGSMELQRVAPLRAVVESCGATYICAPGEMQSPPLDWPHGGGEFIRLFAG
jgi:hypothetical protein